MFQITLTSVLQTLLYMIPGFLLCKCKKGAAEHLPTVSGILIYICSPGLFISSFLNLSFSGENLKMMGLFFLTTLLLQLAFMGLLWLILRKKTEDAATRILVIGSVLGNVGFFGQPVLRAILPDHPEAICYSCMFILSMNLIVFTFGAFCLTKDKKFISVKAAILNPTTISFLVAFPLYLLNGNQWMPTLLTDSMTLLGKMTTPICMIILGMRLSTVSWKKLVSRPHAFFTCLGKLLLFPLFCYAILFFLPFDPVFKTCVVILAGTPCASVILSLAEIYQKGRELSADCLLLSTLLCLATVPLLSLLI